MKQIQSIQVSLLLYFLFQIFRETVNTYFTQIILVALKFKFLPSISKIFFSDSMADQWEANAKEDYLLLIKNSLASLDLF